MTQTLRPIQPQNQNFPLAQTDTHRPVVQQDHLHQLRQEIENRGGDHFLRMGAKEVLTTAMGIAQRRSERRVSEEIEDALSQQPRNVDFDSASALLNGAMTLGATHEDLIEALKRINPTGAEVSECMKDLGAKRTPESIDRHTARIFLNLARQIQTIVFDGLQQVPFAQYADVNQRILFKDSWGTFKNEKDFLRQKTKGWSIFVEFRLPEERGFWHKLTSAVWLKPAAPALVTLKFNLYDASLSVRHRMVAQINDRTTFVFLKAVLGESKKLFENQYGRGKNGTEAFQLYLND